MRSPIILYSRVNPQTGDLEVNEEAFLKQYVPEPDALLDLLPGLTKHTLTLKEKWEQAMQARVDIVERETPQRRGGAMVETYVESWTLPGTPCEQTFAALHPNLADKISFVLEQRVFPSLAGNADFLGALQTLRDRLISSAPEPTSTLSS